MLNCPVSGSSSSDFFTTSMLLSIRKHSFLRINVFFGWKATGHRKIFLSTLKLAANGRDDATDNGLLASLPAPVSPIWFQDK